MISEENLLLLIWKISLVLALGAIAIFAVLVAARARSTRRERRRQVRARELSALMHTVLQSPVDLPPECLPKLAKKDFPILLDVALEMIRTVRGSYVDQIIALVTHLGLYPHLALEAAQGGRASRRKALLLIGYYPDDRSRDILFAAARDPDPYLQITALRGLARHGEIDCSDVLRALAKTTQTNTLMLADVLGRFGETALPVLHDLATTVPDGADETARRHVRRAAIMAIGTIGALGSTTVLRGLLRERDAPLRAAAATALGRIGDPVAVPELAALLRDKAVEVRIRAAEALGELQDEIALPALVMALNDAAWGVRFRAAEALGRTGGKGLVALRAIARRDGPEGEIASQVLAEMAVAG
ncbi:HEAT repeat domain-containing protein [Rhodobacter lacus]|uniref:HEAT repeat domain-containing protein n=1 Tax=Rhodobacter lacus TaxID=1641972 RepID=A0ABW5AA42_9RHOB